MAERRLATALRVATTLAVLAVLVWWSDPRALAAAFRQVDAGLWLAAGAALLAAALVGGFNLHLVLRRHSGRPFGEFLRVYWVGWAAGLVTPGQVGDLAAISLMLKRRGIDWRGTLARSLLDKSLSLLVMAGFAGAAAVDAWPRLPHAAQWSGWAWTSVAITAALLAAVWSVRRHPRLAALRNDVSQVARDFVTAIRQQPGAVALNLLLTVVKLLLVGVAYWLMLRGFGANPPGPLTTAAVATASGLLAYLPISINGIGPVEAAGVTLFRLYQIPVAEILSGYLALRVTTLALAWLPASALLLAWRTPPQQ